LLFLIETNSNLEEHRAFSHKKKSAVPHPLAVSGVLYPSSPPASNRPLSFINVLVKKINEFFILFMLSLFSALL
jgi:hypothetical protein